MLSQAEVAPPAIELGGGLSEDGPNALVLRCFSWTEVLKDRDAVVAADRALYPMKEPKNLLKFQNTESTENGAKPKTTFSGTIKFVGGLGVLAIISDDGCTVTAKEHDTGKALPKLIKKAGTPQALGAAAFSPLPFVFKMDVLYDIEVEYIQVQYSPKPGRPDIDGATLYACHLSGVFEEVSPASGFDKYTEPHWLMIPEGGANRAKVLTTATPSHEVRLDMVPAVAGATLVPTAVHQSPETITVTSSTVGQGAMVVIGDGSTFATEGLNLTVKPRREKTVILNSVTQVYTTPMPLEKFQGKPNEICIQGAGALRTKKLLGDDKPGPNFTVLTGDNGLCETPAATGDTPLMKVGEGICKDLVPVGVPSKGAFQEYLNKIFGIQANVFFTVDEKNLKLDYDITEPRNRELNMGEFGKDLSNEEKVLVKDEVRGKNIINLYFIHDWDLGLAKLGRAVVPTHAYVRTLYNDLISQTAAHEVGHTLGILYHSDVRFLGNPGYLPGVDLGQRLMRTTVSPLIDNPVLIKGEWDLINKD